jgi:hypothetical protein
MYKIFEECMTQDFGKPHIFRIKQIVDFGLTSFSENCTLGGFEYIYRVEGDDLVQMTKITTRCDNNLFAVSSKNFLWLKWLDKSFIKNKKNKNAKDS